MPRFKTLKEFVDDANATHGEDTYDYSNATLSNRQDKIEILCKKHNLLFSQRASAHLQGAKCPLCAFEKRVALRTSNTEEFIRKALLIHGNKYDYSLVDYVTAIKKVQIICNKCGKIFLQTPNKHLMRRGCQNCCKAKNEHGFTKKGFTNKYKFGILYIAHISNEHESFIKIGITGKSIKHRFKSFPYNYSILHKINTTSSNVYDIETAFKKKLKDFRYTPEIDFGGKTECYTQEALPEIRNYLFNF